MRHFLRECESFWVDEILFWVGWGMCGCMGHYFGWVVHYFGWVGAREGEWG